ncbi:MAG: acyl-CoA reductase [Bacteroidetes bacterium]|nr:acyl-CoA reductase [Bacteroidota bacterium]
MKLQERIEILIKLGEYLSASADTAYYNEWNSIVQQASRLNPWFTPENTQQAANAIFRQFLQKDLLEEWANSYRIKKDHTSAKRVGIVMAGNIPMVGFHDLLCTFISGHQAICKLSSKDNVLLPHLATVMGRMNANIQEHICFAERLSDCDAYIATGSDNSARYFNYYFGKYPSIIRKNRTSVAVLKGNESKETLDLLADDILSYFGLGCRNVTQICVPHGYDFLPLLEALKKYSHYFEHAKYKNNFDYQLTIYIMNNLFYMTNQSIVLIENEQPFSPIGTLHYKYYENETSAYQEYRQHPAIQAIVGENGLPFGKAQEPGLTDYADGVDVMRFLTEL